MGNFICYTKGGKHTRKQAASSIRNGNKTQQQQQRVLDTFKISEALFSVMYDCSMSIILNAYLEDNIFALG